MEKQLVLNQSVLLVKNQKTFPAANQDIMVIILTIVKNVLHIYLLALFLPPIKTANARTYLLTTALHAPTNADLTTQ